MKDQQADPSSKLTMADFVTDQEVRWCPGCGDYSILKQVQRTLVDLEVKREDIVFISGIGCSSRFPYYMNTYGMHGIHGRAPAIATGLKSARPELSVWLITGDGDALSIGGNHTIHMLRRNPNINVLLFNNEIYGLTKGQYSPTSPKGKVTKSTPMGSIDDPFNPLALVLGANGSFVARSMDRDPKHMREILMRANEHKGTSFLEIYQNCNVFNDGAFFEYTEKGSKPNNALFLNHGMPLVFGENEHLGIRLEDASKPVVVDLQEGKYAVDDLWVHDEADRHKANLLASFFELPESALSLPRPFGVLYCEQRATYEQAMADQLNNAIETMGDGDLDELLRGQNFWEVQ